MHQVGSEFVDSELKIESHNGDEWLVHGRTRMGRIVKNDQPHGTYLYSFPWDDRLGLYRSPREVGLAVIRQSLIDYKQRLDAPKAVAS